MGSNRKWASKAIEALKAGNLDYWNSNKGYMSNSEIEALEAEHLSPPAKENIAADIVVTEAAVVTPPIDLKPRLNSLKNIKPKKIKK
jgi:hypothetical protein